TFLSLAQNEIDNLEPLSGLTSLEWLNLDHNKLKNNDLEPLCELSNLSWMTIEHNQLSKSSKLKCVKNNGADVYWDMQDTDNRRSFRADTSWLPPEQVFEPSVFEQEGYLTHRVASDGTMSFTYVVGDELLEVLPEFGGAIKSDGRYLRHCGSEERTIGELGPEGLTLCSGFYADVCEFSLAKISPAMGTAHPDWDVDPLVTMTLRFDLPDFADSDQAFLVRSAAAAGGKKYRDMDPCVLASPNQYDAGSCLFMATTGSMEILMNQHTPVDDIDYWGPTDLSERFLLSAYDDVPNSWTGWFFTDLNYTYNYHSGSMLDEDYPFVMEVEDGYYTARPNWDDRRPNGWKDMLVATPEIERTVIFIDPDQNNSSQWAVGLMDYNMIEIIKNELRTKNAPVMIIYNHYMYWHADLIIGYNDGKDSKGCPMVNSTLGYFDDQGANSYINTIENHMDDLGGCVDKGIFYVRDSIYDGTSDEPSYDYGSYKDKYSARIIERTYNWPVYLGNHAYSIHRK
ncbi:MAG: leucine-rich repeat domain-containing protein, partial [Proteobacteria bacterium]|nr:leucine-rich repeat domain-containing protein [Pseudomonadota bacterium]